MKVLVLSEEYPNNDGIVKLMYVHTRNVYYKEHGIEETELNFHATKKYVFQGIKVITLKDYEESTEEYDILILHAANIKHHYRFLKKYGDRFPKFLFFYHGHEVLRVLKVYSKNYPFVKVDKIKALKHNLYDMYKLMIWRKYLPKVMHKSHLVFVSNWMYEEFLKWVRIPENVIRNHYSITYNCVGKVFEESNYNSKCNKDYDFVTIRSNLDNSKYAVDVVNKLAQNTPKGRFLLVGKGEFFEHFEKAPNLEWRNQTMLHEDILNVLNQSRYALMPTRTDAQGLMMCEMAAFGIPVITSDIPVCHEVFEDFENAFFIDNDNENNLDKYLSMEIKGCKHTKFYEEETAEKELKILYSLNGE